MRIVIEICGPTRFRYVESKQKWGFVANLFGPVTGNGHGQPYDVLIAMLMAVKAHDPPQLFRRFKIYSVIVTR